jgi:outer membrane lipopolysaccharide assembly protein LptE/RlpB
MSKRLLYLVIAAGVLALSAPSWTISQQPANMQNGWLPSIPAGSSSANEAMIVTSNRTLNGNTQMVIVDTQRKAIAVYEIASDSGAIQLKSVRNMTADFLLDEFNGTDPTPEKVRGILTNP